jgi:hypothetical protein
MADFLNWLSSGSMPSILFITVVSFLVIGIVVAYAVALFQGREISFWPPKIGQKPDYSSPPKINFLKEFDVDSATANFVLRERGDFSGLMTKVIQSIESASEEILILDYNPLEKGKAKVRYSHEDKINSQRRRYYETIINKVNQSEPGSFKYNRILQIPPGRNIAEVLADDPIFREHCELVVKISEQKPEIASLKTCTPLYTGNYIIIDKRYMILEFTILDPENQYERCGGSFFFDDTTGKFVKSFVRYFERADAHSTLVDLASLQS